MTETDRDEPERSEGENVADWLRRERKRLRLTQQEVADELGVNVRSVNNWENGRHVPRSTLYHLRALFADDKTVGPPAQDAGVVMLSLPPELTEGMSPADIEEIATAARLRAFEKAREIRGSQ